MTLSFDDDVRGDSNAYLPLAFLGLDWFQGRGTASTPDVQRLGFMPKPAYFSQGRTPDSAERGRFACAFIGQSEPMRMRAIEALSSIAPVDVFGHASGRPRASKLEVAVEYRFMVCFENDVYPGYVTEKALDAWACGCIPLWRGDDAVGILNGGAYLNLQDFADMKTFTSRVRELNSDRSQFAHVWSQPLATAPWSLDSVKALLRRKWATHCGSRA